MTNNSAGLRAYELRLRNSINNKSQQNWHHCCRLPNKVENIDCRPDIPHIYNGPGDAFQNCPFPWGDLAPPHTHLMALCPGLPRWAGTKKVKPIWILLRQETVSGTGSGISWTICKSAPRSRQITTPAPHHSVFLQVGCYSCHPTNSVKALKAKVAGELTAKSCITVATYQIRLRISTAGQILPIFTMGREMPSKLSPFRGGILPPHTPI